MDRNIDEVLDFGVDSLQGDTATLSELDQLQLAMAGGGIADIIGV